MTLVPIPSGKGDLPFAFDIAMGVKPGNEALRAREGGSALDGATRALDRVLASVVGSRP